MTMSLDEARAKLIRLARKWQRDPLAFAQNAFPWGVGTLAGMKGPDEWQTRVLTEVRDRIREGKSFDEVFRLAVASGNGIGKSCLVAWLCLWAISTMADTRGVVTANTDTQLRTKTFAELAKWFNLCISGRGSICPRHRSQAGSLGTKNLAYRRCAVERV